MTLECESPLYTLELRVLFEKPVIEIKIVDVYIRSHSS